MKVVGFRMSLVDILTRSTKSDRSGSCTHKTGKRAFFVKPLNSMSRGFTLIEMIVVLAIVTILVGAGLLAVQGMGNTASFSSMSSNLVGSLRYARAAATERGTYTAFIIDTAGSRWWGVLAPSGMISLDTFDPSDAGTVLVSGTFVPSPVAFGPDGGYGQSLPAPLGTIPILPGQTPNLPYCSFCRTSGNNTGFGEILFEPSGQTKFWGTVPTNVIGQQFTINGPAGNTMRIILVVLVSRTGAIETFTN
jgi:prepilin-type N-terminal cleavage/methylation domain-containing protein